MIVYKYLHPDRINVLENGMIRFSQLHDLNDPFETNISDLEYRREIKRQQSDENRRRFATLGEPADVADATLNDLHDNVLPARFRETTNATILILSLTKTPGNLLMWSHYGDQHRGFVIGFDATSDFFMNNEKIIHPLRDVAYSPTRYALPAGATPETDWAAAQDWLQGFLFTKSEGWQYEEEIRMTSMPMVADRTIPTAGLPICLFQFQPDCVAEVIMGANMQIDHQNMLVEVVTRTYPSARLLQAELDDYQFHLNIVPFVRPWP